MATRRFQSRHKLTIAYPAKKRAGVAAWQVSRPAPAASGSLFCPRLTALRQHMARIGSTLRKGMQAGCQSTGQAEHMYLCRPRRKLTPTGSSRRFLEPCGSTRPTVSRVGVEWWGCVRTTSVSKEKASR